MTTIQLRISDDLAKAAEEEGLLRPEALTEILREAVRRKAGKKLLDLTAPAAAIDAMPEEDVSAFVQSVIGDVRADKRAGNARSA